MDLVAAGILGVAAAALAGEQAPVYQLASGDVNPFMAARAVELVGLYRRRVYRRRESAGKLDALKNQLASRLEMRPVSERQYQLLSAPMLMRATGAGRRWLTRLRPRWGAPGRVRRRSRRPTSSWRISSAKRAAWSTIDLVPFPQNAYTFRCSNT